MDFGPTGERATDGNAIYPNQAAIAYGYDGSGNLTTETLTQYGSTYVKTYTWTSGKLAAESLWVKQ